MFRLLIALFTLLSSSLALAQVRACGGDSNWPPMSYQLHLTSAVEGFSPDILRQIFPDSKISLRPWMRCLVEVQAGTSMDIAMSVLKNPEREKTYLFSHPYHALTPAYLYAVQRYPQPPIQQLSDFASLKVCSLHGAVTSYSKLTPAQIDSGAPNYTSLMKKIDRGYCEVVIDMREVFLGFAKLGLLPFDSQQYRIQTLPDTEKYPLHYAVSKSHPQAAELIATINKRIAELQKSGKLASIVQQYQAGKSD